MQRSAHTRTAWVGLGWALAALMATSACVPVIMGGAATVGLAAAQERTVGDALDDTAIGLRVKDGFLAFNSNLFAKVSVDVVEGRVLLTGVVPAPQDRVDAVRIAWQVPGVKEVLNELQVNNKTSIADYFSDVRISTELRYRMVADTAISEINYNIDTVNATIYLIGIAQNQAELDRVTNYARSIKGVKQVVSHVRLKDDPRRG